MAVIASRYLRNHTADVLRRVQGGDSVTVTINGEPVAEIIPVRSAQRTFIPKRELIEILATRQADPQLRDDLASLAGETTDDLGPMG